MLTEEAMWARAWEEFPTLGRILGAKQIPDHYLGRTTRLNIHRLMRISILIRENADQLRGPEPDEKRNGKLKRSMRFAENPHGGRSLECAARQFHAESLGHGCTALIE